MTSTEWKTHLEQDEDNELLRFSYAKALFDEKKWSQASEQFEILVKNKPDYAIAWAYLARSYLLGGNRESARGACDIGLPIAMAQKHETPEEEIRSVLAELDSEF